MGFSKVRGTSHRMYQAGFGIKRPGWDKFPSRTILCRRESQADGREVLHANSVRIALNVIPSPPATKSSGNQIE